MKQIIAILILGFLLFGNSYPSSAASRLALETFNGIVNKQEIGDGEYFIISIWDGRGYIPLHADNSFTVVVSTQRPQKISLVDNQKKVRALAVVVPGFTPSIVFDARSTALAVLFSDPDVFRQSPQVATLLARMEKGFEFQAFVAYLRKNLAGASLESLSKEEEYITLVENCQKEIFGEDQKEIMSSLQDAEKELGKVMR